MAMQEKRRPTPPNPEDVVSGMRFFAENIRRDVDFNNRSGSISIKDSLLGLKESLKLEPTKTKSILADTAGDLLEALKEKNTDGYPTYARMDILEGLGGFEDPKMQLVIAKSLDDPQEMVTKRAQDLLTRKDIEIFPETLKFLLNAKDPKNTESYDPEKTELALSIVEKNKKAGVWSGAVDATTGQALLDVLLDRRVIEGGKHRAAVIVSKLHSRTPKQVIRGDQLMQLAINQLWSEFVVDVERMSLRENFDQLVDTIHNSNLSSARATGDIPEISGMDLVLPPEHEAIAILSEMSVSGHLTSSAQMRDYSGIRALAAQQARVELKNTIANERERERQRAEQRRIEEAGKLSEQGRQKQEGLLKKQEEMEERLNRIVREQTLASLAEDHFPHLTA